MQAIESRGQLKVAAAQRRKESAYWRAQFEGGWERSCFSYDVVTHANESAGSGTLTWAIEPPLSERLLQIASGKELALQAIVTAAVVALLRRHARSNDVVVGQPTLPGEDGRTPLAAALPIRIAVDPTCTFKDLLGRVRKEMQEAIAHQDCPIELFAEEFALPEGPGINPFFDVAIAMTGHGASGLKARVPCSMLFSVEVSGSLVHVSATFDAGKFRPNTAESILKHLIKMLEEAIGHPDTRVCNLGLLDEKERAVLEQANATSAPFDELVRIEEIFTRQAMLTPNAPAVVGHGYSLSYAELDERSNRLANTLRSRGVIADQIVAVFVERSPEMMVAILGILKAGGAYLPLDPGYPQARIEYVLADSGAQLILASPAMAAKLKTDRPILDLGAPASYSGSAAQPAGPGTSRNLAYVIYTSGSTGTPKGVLIEHRSVINRIHWMQKAYPIGARDVILQKTPISFDVSVWELFWWSFVGAQVCLLPPGGERDPEVIVEAIARHHVTTLHFVPSMLNAFLDYVGATDAAGRLAGLRWVFSSGEALEAHQVRRFQQVLGGDLVNLYGPTEATVDVSHYHCPRDRELECIPIGRPIDNIRLYVVDEQMNVLPVGIPGELCIAGVGLARGYHNRPELTAERFIEGRTCGEDRLYRTGDLARWSPEGEIEYLGRLDQQVKIRGYRIEIGEIEQRLRQHPEVKDAVVVARKAEDGQNQLAGYVVCESTVEADGLRAFLAENLPEYMIPANIVVLEKFPLSPNGKLDRGALPDPRMVKTGAAPFVAPRTETEQVLAEIWGGVLGLKQVGIHDNFFALGGNSIHFVTVLARTRTRGLVFSFQQLFAHPTIAELAASLAGSIESEPLRQQFAPFELLTPQDRSRIPAGAEDAYPLSMLQAGLIFQNELTFGTAQYHDIISYTIQSPLNLDAFEQAVRILVDRHVILRTSYHLSGFDEYIQIVNRDTPLPLYISDQRGMSEDEQEAWFASWLNAEKAHRFEWEKGGLVRFHIHVLRDDLYRYTLSQHNSALDGWSITLIHTQLFDLYYALQDGRSAVQPQVDNHLRNYIGLERQALQSRDDRLYWASHLQGALFTRLPRWTPERESQTLSVIFHDVDIPPRLSDRIVALADRLAVPVKTLLMTAHLKVLSALSGDRDVMTGYEHSGRPEVEDATEAVGLFLNTVPFRVMVEPCTWEQLVRRVYDAEMHMLPSRRYPMAQVKHDLGTQEQLFETAFNYTHFYLLKKLKNLPEFALLDVRANSETEFVLRAEFSRHFFTDQIRLSLHYHDHVFSPEQVALFGGYYRRALELMTEDASAGHHSQSLLDCEELALPSLRLRMGDIPEPIQPGWPDAGHEVRIHVLDDSLQRSPLGAPGEAWIEVDGEQPLDAKAENHARIKGQNLRCTKLAARRLPGGQIEWLSRSHTGRLRFGVATEPGTEEGGGDAYTPPATEAQKQIATVWAKVLGLPLEEISVDDNFFDLGGNSLAVMRAAILLNRRISLADFMRNSTLWQLAKVLESKEALKERRLLHRISSETATEKYSLICFPYAGGNAIHFRPLAHAFAEAGVPIALYAVELPGHDVSKPGEKLLDLKAVASLVAEEVSKRIHTKVLLWGHCVGSAYAIETARILEGMGIELDRIFVGGKLLPPLEEIEASIAEVTAISDEQVLEVLMNETGYDELSSFTSENSRALAALFRHDSLSANGYLAEVRRQGSTSRLAAPMTLVVAADDPLTPGHEERFSNWGLLASAVDLKEIEGGGHYFCRTRPADVASIVMSQCLNEMAIH